MALTRVFRITIQQRCQHDVRFRRAMLTEALNNFLGGEIRVGKSMLRDYINATVGFEALAETVGIPSKSLHRMLAVSGNPNADHFFRIVKALQEEEGVDLQISIRRRAA